MNRVSIRRITKRDIQSLVCLHEEFEQYLKDIDHNRISENIDTYKERLTKDGFDRGRYFNGFIAIENKIPVGYIFYHVGYDPDEMKGPVVYIIDLFVSISYRKKGIGRMLLEKVTAYCKSIRGVNTYLYCWNKNISAIKFYDSLNWNKIDDFIIYTLK